MPLRATTAPSGPADEPRSETTLVARAQDGDVVAFEELVRRYERPLFRLAYRILYDRDEAEDAVQESLILAWRKLAVLADPQAFRSWIYRVTTRQCLNSLRSRRRTRTELVAADDLAAGDGAPTLTVVEDDPAAHSQLRDLQQDLARALHGLPDDLRVCWILNELQDLSYPEMATILGVPVSTVRGRLARARLKLAKDMAPWQ